MNAVLYALLCVLVPVVWGLIVAWASALLEKRRGADASDAPEPIAQDDRI